MREELRLVLKNYELPAIEDVHQRTHGPDLRSYAFSVQGRDYLLVELEMVGADLQDKEYTRLQEAFGLDRQAFKLVLPRLEQMHTTTNQEGLGIDGHGKIEDFNEDEDLDGVIAPAQYKNPNLIDSGTTFVLFELT
jgi:hypothetical protein